jgi:hypothetical protein
MKALPLVFVSLLLALGSAGPAAAQVDVTVTAAMVKGPERAPITIVEFFDFE